MLAVLMLNVYCVVSVNVNSDVAESYQNNACWTAKRMNVIK